MINLPSGSTRGEASRFSLGPALLLRPQVVGLWFLGVYKIYPLNFCHCDLSEIQ